MNVSLPALAALTLVACAQAGAAATKGEFSVTRLQDNVYAILRNDPPGFAVESNAGLIECADYGVVVDAQSNDATTERVLAEIRRHTDKPVRYLINTHARRLDEAQARGESLETARSHIDLSELRRQLSNGSEVKAALFDAYIAGPGVANAWKFR